MIPCFPRHARRIRLEWRTVRSIVKRILVTCAATTALALLLTMVLCALGNAIGSIVGGAALTATAMNYHFTGIAGAPISLLAVILLVLYTRRYEARA